MDVIGIYWDIVAIAGVFNKQTGMKRCFKLHKLHVNWYRFEQTLKGVVSQKSVDLRSLYDENEV